MKIRYTIADGYIGQAGRPHSANVYDCDILNCETEAEVRQLIEECVHDHFEQNIFPETVDSDVDEAVAFWEEQKETEQPR